MTGLLQIVSTPIGNPADLSARALEALRHATAIICEEQAAAQRLLAPLGVLRPLVELNEHTDSPALIEELVARLVRGDTLALISDHGTPLLADPGQRLVTRTIQSGMRVTAVPGASALLAALVVSGLPMSRFRFVGMLSPKTDLRRAELGRLKQERDTWVVLDAPYRLGPLLHDLRDILRGNRPVAVACNLTQPDENVVRGTLDEVVAWFEKNPFRGEFVIVIQGAPREPRPGEPRKPFQIRSKLHSRR